MEIYKAYCSACDREVRVTLDPERDGRTDVRDVESVVCLEHGESCTGEMCPVFGVPTDEMRENLERVESRGGQARRRRRSR